MTVSESLGVNENGHLTFAKVDMLALAKEYGTPLYVFDEDLIRKNCRGFLTAINEYYDGFGSPAYASKAFCCTAAARIMKEEGMSLDTVSAGEIYTALKAGFPAERILFHGNNKSDDELEYAIKNNVGRIVIDGFYDISRIDNIAGRLQKKVKALIRITPGIDAHTHDFVKTGQIDSKFGITLENGDAMKAVGMILSLENIDLCGLHCHIGSQIFDTEPFAHAAQVMIGFIADIKKAFGYEIRELDLGGGFGIRYYETDELLPYGEYMKVLLEAVKSECDKYSLSRPFIFVEPGRSIVGAAGITLYTVGRIKEIAGVKNYVAVDGGMTDDPRYALYGSHYELSIADRASEKKTYKADIVGKCCESGDIIQPDAYIQKPRTGDILAVFSTGAYNYSMSSNYNRLRKPPVVMIKDGKSRIVVKRETFEDLVRNDIDE